MNKYRYTLPLLAGTQAYEWLGEAPATPRAAELKAVKPNSHPQHH